MKLQREESFARDFVSFTLGTPVVSASLILNICYVKAVHFSIPKTPPKLSFLTPYFQNYFILNVGSFVWDTL